MTAEPAGHIQVNQRGARSGAAGAAAESGGDLDLAVRRGDGAVQPKVSQGIRDAQRRWILVDAQIDDLQRGWFSVNFDVTDVPRDRFLTGGRAWAHYRSGTADPAMFGLTMTGEAGDWWIAANLMRDAAALRNIELLPWDCWGAMPKPDDTIDGELALLFDRLAALTETPDASHAELDRLCREDERLRVPPAVRSAARNRYELLCPDQPDQQA
jgi:hypothetical protein